MRRIEKIPITAIRTSTNSPLENRPTILIKDNLAAVDESSKSSRDRERVLALPFWYLADHPRDDLPPGHSECYGVVAPLGSGAVASATRPTVLLQKPSRA